MNGKAMTKVILKIKAMNKDIVFLPTLIIHYISFCAKSMVDNKCKFQNLDH